jgi:predicted TPR repeat methyltransferase
MALVTPSDLTAVEYDRLAPYYDRFTAGYEYDNWISGIERHAIRHGLEGARALDLACGTGKSTEPLLARGYSVLACDISEEMIRAARVKLPEDADNFFVADMRDLPSLGEFDFVLCLDDAINYLLSDSELEATFAGVARALSPHGVFAFDVNSLLTYRTSFAETFVSEQDGIVFTWRGEATPEIQPGEMATATVEIFAKDDEGRWERHAMRHVQRHHPRQAIQAALENAGLECCLALGQHRGARLEEGVDESRHIKVVYLARRASWAT